MVGELLGYDREKALRTMVGLQWVSTIRRRRNDNGLGRAEQSGNGKP